MLNGVAPILIFTLKENPAALSPIFNALSGIPLIGDQLASVVEGVPIPLYLDEKITGLYVENEAKNVDIDTQPFPKMDNGKPLNYQRLINSSVTVNLLATHDSILLPALLALVDLITPRLVSQNYAVSYANGSTLILGGLLSGLNTAQGSDDDLIRITLQIQRTDQRTQIPTGLSLPNVPGTIPTGGN